MYNLIISMLLVLITPSAIAKGIYQAPEVFVAEAFTGSPPKPAVVWLTGNRKEEVKQIWGRDYSSLRIRYWGKDRRTVWVLEEIGKEQPITVGVQVDQGKIEQFKVLAFRESRGDEVRHPFFTNQFRGRSLKSDYTLDSSIDGISGATLSVRALKKIARLALYLHSEVSAPSKQ